MFRRHAVLLALWLGLLLGAARLPASAQSPGLQVFNTRREIVSRIWGAGPWIVFCVEENERDLNGDGDTDDTVLALSDLRSFETREIGAAIDFRLTDSDDEWPVAVEGDWLAIRVAEADQGRQDLDGNGTVGGDALCLYQISRRQLVPLGVAGRQPRFSRGRLYFLQMERTARRDLNGDGDLGDEVLCACDPATRQIESLGMEASLGYQVAGEWIAALAREAAQGGRDLNGDGDTLDAAPQLYSLSRRQWTNTALEASAAMQLTPKLLALGVSEARQGGRDLNGDGDTQDVIAEVWDLARGEATNTGQDCSSGLAADDTLVAWLTPEKEQGVDLNGDGDRDDEGVQVYTLGAARPLSLRYDGSGGIAVGRGRVVFAVDEKAQAGRDLNRDQDTDDFVLLTYDSRANRISSTGYTVDEPPVAVEGTLVWRVMEADQGDRDLNRDQDSNDTILCAMDLDTGTVSPLPFAVGLYAWPVERGVGFAVSELEQGEADLNGDREPDDDILFLARWSSRR